MTTDEKNLDTLRKRIRKAMKLRGIKTQREAALETSTDPVEVSRVLNGKDPRYTTAMRLLTLEK